jgi:tRNA threonylcarbamoyladenosine biosynthesis protein TsaB
MEERPLILSLDTATLGGSTCLALGSQVLATRLGDPAVSHSETLLRDIEELLKEAGRSVTDVDLFAAASGPGSFTGLRIGLATIKAFSAFLHRPCAGLPTLETIAYAAGPSQATVALLPAGRGELFAQLLSVAPDGEVIEIDTASHLSPEKVLDRYKAERKLVWAGPGARQHSDLIQKFANQRRYEFGVVTGEVLVGFGDGWVVAAREANLAPSVAALALQRFKKGKTGGPESIEAFYVRPSDAELKVDATS